MQIRLQIRIGFSTLVLSFGVPPSMVISRCRREATLRSKYKRDQAPCPSLTSGGGRGWIAVIWNPYPNGAIFRPNPTSWPLCGQGVETPFVSLHRDQDIVRPGGLSSFIALSPPMVAPPCCRMITVHRICAYVPLMLLFFFCRWRERSSWIFET
jgi:hypothetical protein